jgi:hypothetical protein
VDSTARERVVLALNDLAEVLSTLLVESDGDRVSTSRVKFALGQLGYSPKPRELSLALVARGGVQSEGAWYGLAFRKGGLVRLQRLIQKKWDKDLRKLGMTPEVKLDRFSGWTAQPTTIATGRMTWFANEARNAQARAEIAGGYEEKLSRYLWSADWVKYHPIDRAIVERRLETGESYREMAEHFGLHHGVVKRALRVHEREAGWLGTKKATVARGDRGKRGKWV